MRTIAYNSCPEKNMWGQGPWTNEPDKVQWRDKATRLPCLIVRNTTVTGALCGYVGVGQRHALYGQGWGSPLIGNLSVHGGITFAGFCTKGGDESTNICHIAGPGEIKKVWWLGFDCSHAGDLSPRMEFILGGIKEIAAQRTYHNQIFADYPDVYRDFPYVRREVESLALQLAAL